MQNNKKYRYSVTVFLVTSLLLLSCNTGAREQSTGSAMEIPSAAKYATGVSTGIPEREYSDCRRHRVVWSGGVAVRGRDRISPRPVRSRWQRAGQSRIRCTGGESFDRIQVADQPWVR